MALGREVAAVGRLEAAEVLRSRWLLFSFGVYGVIAAAFVLVGLRESTLMGFSGMGRVLLSFAHALVLLLPLLALTATGQVVNRARDDGTLELLFTLPVRRSAYFLAVTAVRYAVLVLPLVILMLAMALFGRLAFGQEIPWFFLGRAVALSVTLLWAFTGLGIAVSTFVRSQAKATIWLLVLWAAGVALVDFALVGAMLQWRLHPATVFTLATLNPVQSARMALLSGLSPELSVLGPVGFFLAHRIGPNALLALGLLWPALVGTLAWLVALRRFWRSDLV